MSMNKIAVWPSTSGCCRSSTCGLYVAMGRDVVEAICVGFNVEAICARTNLKPAARALYITTISSEMEGEQTQPPFATSGPFTLDESLRPIDPAAYKQALLDSPYRMAMVRDWFSVDITIHP